MITSRAKKLAAGQPMAHQRVSLAHDEKTECLIDTSDAGTGKTAVRVWAFAKRRRKGGGKALVFAPRTLLRSAWQLDFKKFAPDMTVSVATAANREKAFKVDADAYITNHDAVKWVAKQKKAFFAQFSELIIDELTAFKHHTSQRSRAALKISKHFKRRAGLTATFNPNGICDTWHQALIIDAGKRLGNSFYSFRNTVCSPEQVTRDKNAIKWTDKPGAEEAVFGLLSDIVIRHNFKDCVDIPPTHHYQVPFELPHAQQRVYDTMQEAQLLILIPDLVAAKLGGGPAKITAINAAAVATKLLQIASGAVYDGAGQYHLLNTDRYELLLDMIEARKRSLVYFYWRHQKEQLAKLAESRGIPYTILDGDATDNERTQRIAAYQRGEYRVLFGHPLTVAHGTTLTAGQSTIWSGPTYNLEWYKHGSQRQARIGQTEKTEVVTVIAENTIEEAVFEIMTGKNDKMKNLLDLFASLQTKRRAPAANDRRMKVAA